MKHELCAEELARHWSLSFSDLDFINAKPMIGRHALAVQLKYFTANGSFAQSAHDIPAEAMLTCVNSWPSMCPKCQNLTLAVVQNGDTELTF